GGGGSRRRVPLASFPRWVNVTATFTGPLNAVKSGSSTTGNMVTLRPVSVTILSLAEKVTTLPTMRAIVKYLLALADEPVILIDMPSVRPTQLAPPARLIVPGTPAAEGGKV